MRPAKTQISLGIHPVRSESSLCAQRIAKNPSFLHADSEDSDQLGRIPRLIWFFAGRTCHFVGFVVLRVICLMEKKGNSILNCHQTPIWSTLVCLQEPQPETSAKRHVCHRGQTRWCALLELHCKTKTLGRFMAHLSLKHEAVLFRSSKTL